jgi:hypothetical protein
MGLPDYLDWDGTSRIQPPYRFVTPVNVENLKLLGRMSNRVDRVGGDSVGGGMVGRYRRMRKHVPPERCQWNGLEQSPT